MVLLSYFGVNYVTLHNVMLSSGLPNAAYDYHEEVAIAMNFEQPCMIFLIIPLQNSSHYDQ